MLAGALPRMLRLVAREADIAQLQTVDLTGGRQVHPGTSRLAEAEKSRLDLVREAAGERWPDLELGKMLGVVSSDHPERGGRPGPLGAAGPG